MNRVAYRIIAAGDTDNGLGLASKAQVATVLLRLYIVLLFFLSLSISVKKGEQCSLSPLRTRPLVLPALLG